MTSNTPPEPVSPSPSTPSSESPPPEEIQNDPVSPLLGGVPANAAMFVHSPSQAKRRLPTTPAGHNRDLKSRKRDDGNVRKVGAGAWMDGREGGKPREELVDVELADRLRKEFGDPFDEAELKNAA